MEYPIEQSMQEFPQLSYSMGFSVNGTPIPNPSEFSCNYSDLDTMGERDANGYLHRNMVASKYNMKIAWKGVPWQTVMDIGALVVGPKFSFTFICPFTCGEETIEAYAGDRAFTDVWSPQNGVWLGDISFSVIQY